MKKLLQHMTYPEVAEAFKKDPVIIIPLGSMEEHGPQSVTGDYLAAEAIAQRAASAAEDCYAVPIIPFGYSEYFRGFAGTISISPKTLYHLVKDVVRSLTEHGIRKILLLNGHAGNSPILDILSRDLRREEGLMVAKIDLWQSLPLSLKDELFAPEKKVWGHGGEPLTSVMLALTPEHMRLDLCPPAKQGSVSWQDFERIGINRSPLNGVEIGLPFNMEDVAPNGVMGNPNYASAEAGERMLACLTDLTVTLVNKMKASEMQVQG